MTREKLEEAYMLEQEAHRLRIQAAAELQRQQMQLEQAFEHRTGIHIGVSDDYAVLDCGGLRFYYGYEYTVPPTVDDDDDDGEWAFVAWQNGNEVLRLPTSEVHPVTREYPMFYLLAGIAHWLTSKETPND
jgi:hypothetical protein